MIMRRTKIICTLGPATDQPGVLEEIILSGMNVARFNFSHGSHEEHKRRLDQLKELRTRLGRPVAAMLDTRGPEIRLRQFQNGKAFLKEGSTFTLTARTLEGDSSIASITYRDLYQDVRVGGLILLDDGLVSLQIEKIDGVDIICTVLNSGTISDKKGVNVPGVRLSLPYISECQ